MKTSMSVLSLRTTVIHKQDVSTRLVDLGANAEVDTLEMVFNALVSPHSVKYNLYMYNNPMFSI